MQTAVEWLHQIAKQRDIKESDWEQAKLMAKDQIEIAWDVSRKIIDYSANGQQYYNEVYNKK